MIKVVFFFREEGEEGGADLVCIYAKQQSTVMNEACMVATHEGVISAHLQLTFLTPYISSRKTLFLLYNSELQLSIIRFGIQVN